MIAFALGPVHIEEKIRNLPNYLVFWQIPFGDVNCRLPGLFFAHVYILKNRIPG